jgi:hypothetical protein
MDKYVKKSDFGATAPSGPGPPHSHPTTHHSRWDSSGRVISPSRRPLPDNTALTTDRHPCPPVGFEPIISAGERPQTYALDRAATGTGRRGLTFK